LTVAKDVKLQIEFNPAEVKAYRLIGYENRLLEHADFDNDATQGGDIGSGHTVTALFEVVPRGATFSEPAVAPLKYQTGGRIVKSRKGELLTVNIRYKQPEGNRSVLLTESLLDRGGAIEDADRDLQFASAVAAFGMVLRDSTHKGTATFSSVLEVSERSRGEDPSGYRSEFLEMVAKARALEAVGPK
jgi:Ca-activated chloride channel family protein